MEYDKINGGPKRLDLIGQIFGKLLIIGKMPSNKIATRFICQCDCGKEVILMGCEIKRGKHKSCGCSMGKPTTTKNFREHPLYDVWKGMKARCRDEKHKQFHTYGGKGVRVCQEWRTDFFSFYNWAMKNGYKEGLQIDKDIIGNGLLYSPDTCHWVTPAVNCQGKSITKLNVLLVAEIRASSLKRREIAIKYGIHPSTVYKIKKNKIWKI
jgi:hypothetical protein